MSVRDTSIDPRLLQSAKEEFTEHGFLKAELKTICARAGVTTGAVYKRYKGKEELFRAIVRNAAEKLDEFITDRSGTDYSVMTDDEMRRVWTMDEESILEMFRMLWEIREEFFLLLEKSAGTAYENYGHDFAFRMTQAYMRHYREVKKRGLATAEISEREMHVLCSAFWTTIYEPFIHHMSFAEIEGHCKVICRYFSWAKAIGLK